MGHFAAWLRLREGTDEDLKDQIMDARGMEQIVQVLNAAGVDMDQPKSVEPLIVFDGEHGQRYVIDDMDNPWPEEAETWISKEMRGGRADKWIEFPDENEEFWRQVRPGSQQFHGTTAEAWPAIQAQGLVPGTKTRGMTNRGVGAAVFLHPSAEYCKYHYGEVVLAVDVARMKADGYMPRAEREPPAVEYDQATALAHLIGLEGFHWDTEDGIDMETVILYGKIPPQYLRRVL